MIDVMRWWRQRFAGFVNWGRLDTLLQMLRISLWCQLRRFRLGEDPFIYNCFSEWIIINEYISGCFRAKIYIYAKYRNKLNKEYNLILITFIPHSIFSATNIERMFRYHNNITICVGLYRALSYMLMALRNWQKVQKVMWRQNKITTKCRCSPDRVTTTSTYSTNNNPQST